MALHLLCPVTVQSPTSLLPQEKPGESVVSNWMDSYVEDVQIYHDNTAAYQQAVDSGRIPLPAGEDGTYVVTGPDGVSAPATAKDTVLPVLTAIWLCGAAALILYTAVSYFRLRRKLATAVRLEDDIYQSDEIQSPFVMGLFDPRIYLPFHLPPQDIPYVIAHEQTHIRRGDFWWKPLGLALVMVHWFNPFMWVAYIVLCRDIELACDEAVIRAMKNEQRAAYSQALLSCSLRSHHAVSACPLAFGEIGVKERVRAILQYRKPAFWVLCVALAAVPVMAACFLTRPPVSREFPMTGRNLSELDTDLILAKIREVEQLSPDVPIYTSAGNPSVLLDAELNWMRDGTIRYYYPVSNHGMRGAQLRVYSEEDKYFLTESSKAENIQNLYPLDMCLNALKHLPLEEIRALSPDADAYAVESREMLLPEEQERTIYYNEDGVCPAQQPRVSLVILPLHASPNGGYGGSGEEGIPLLYTAGPNAYPEYMVLSEMDAPLLDATQAQLEAAQSLYENWYLNALLPAMNIKVGNMEIHPTNTVYLEGKAYRPVLDARYTSLSDLRKVLHQGFTDAGLSLLGLDRAEAYYRELDGTLYRQVTDYFPVWISWEDPVLGIVEETDTHLTLRLAVSPNAKEVQFLPDTTAVDLYFVLQNGSWKLDGQNFYTGTLPAVDTPVRDHCTRD